MLPNPLPELITTANDEDAEATARMASRNARMVLFLILRSQNHSLGGVSMPPYQAIALIRAAASSAFSRQLNAEIRK